MRAWSWGLIDQGEEPLETRLNGCRCPLLWEDIYPITKPAACPKHGPDHAWHLCDGRFRLDEIEFSQRVLAEWEAHS